MKVKLGRDHNREKPAMTRASGVESGSCVLEDTGQQRDVLDTRREGGKGGCGKREFERMNLR